MKRSRGGWRQSYVPGWDRLLHDRVAQGLYRTHGELGSPQGPVITYDGKELLNFCSNDYLGFANHPSLKEAAIKAVERYGVGSGASHLVVGHSDVHEQLANAVAQYTKRDKALVFSSGYMANLAAISSLVSKSDIVLQDKLNHASLIDAGMLSGARFQRYLHNDVTSLKIYLNRFLGDPGVGELKERKSLVVTDGVFSMDGDVAPLKGLATACEHFNSLMMVDDAHGIGVLGPNGRGSVAEAGLTQEDVPVLIGTFGKALGTSGAFIAGPAELVNYLLQVARPYIYTTAMPPSIAAVTVKSVELAYEAESARSHLSSLISAFRHSVASFGYALLDSSSPIQPIIVKDSVVATRLSAFLKENDVLVTAIRPPTVPRGTARLRVTFSASHNFDHLEKLLSVLKKAKEVGLVDE